MKVEDVMTTGVMSLRETDTIDRASADMKLGEMRHLPVIDAKNHVVGILSDCNLYRALGSGGRGRSIPVAEIMIRRVHTIRPEAPIHAAVRLMVDRKIGSLPVVSDEQELIGIVTETDFMAVLLRLLGHPLDEVA